MKLGFVTSIALLSALAVLVSNRSLALPIVRAQQSKPLTQSQPTVSSAVATHSTKEAAAHFQKGETFKKQKDWPDAEAEFAQAVRLQPNDARYHYSPGVTLYSQRKLTETERELRKAVMLEPNNALYHAELGSYFHLQERLQEAQEEYEEALRIDPPNKSVQEGLSQLKARNSEPSIVSSTPSKVPQVGERTQSSEPANRSDLTTPQGKLIEAINATLGHRATKTQQQYEVNKRQLSEVPITELIALRDQLAYLIAVEALVPRQDKTETGPESSIQPRPELVLQTGHLGTVKTVRFSSDGRFLLSGSEDSTAKLWDVSTGRELRTFAERGTEGTVAISPDGHNIAVASGTRVELYDVKTGREIPKYLSQESQITALAFSPDGKWLASGSWAGKIEVFDLTSMRSHSFTAHTGIITSIVISGDSHSLVSAGGDGTIGRWEMESIKELNIIDATFSVSGGTTKLEVHERLDVGRTGKNIWTLRGHIGDVNSLALAADDSWLASTSTDGSIRLWDFRSASELRTLAEHSLQTNAIAIDVKARLIATAGTDKLIKLWDANTGREVRSFAGHTESVTSVAFSPDGRSLASGSTDRTVRLWDIVSGKEVHTFAAQVSVAGIAAFSANGNWLASGSSQEKTLYLWRVGAGLERRRLTDFAGAFPSVVLSQDGQWLAAGNEKGTPIKLWGLMTDSEPRIFPGHSKGISALAISPDDHLLASGSWDNTIKFWELSSGTELRTLTDFVNSPTSDRFSSVHGIAFSPDGQLFAASRSESVKVWDVATGLEVRTLVRNKPPPIPSHILALGGIRSLAFSPNGQLLACAGGDRAVTFWNVTTGQQAFTLGGTSIDIDKVVFDPNGRYLAGLSHYLTERSVTVWDVNSRRDLATLHLGTGNILDLAVSADGRRLITGSADGTRIWDVETGQVLATLLSLRETKDWLVITPDGLFDGSPAAWKRILWRFNGMTFDVADVEPFFSEFYYPNLLTDIMAGERPVAPRSFADLDRRQPNVKLASTVPANTSDARNISVKVEVTEARPDERHSQRGSGAQDLRLFRNGSLVKVWRGDVLKGKSSVTFEATIPIVAGENKLTAYTFSQDNVKSTDGTLTITGADSLKRKGVAYVVAVGVNEYANAQYNLKYAVADALDFAEELKRQQAKLNNYDRVESIFLNDRDATKANVLKSLADLSSKVQPEDALVIFFAGHGTAQQNRFYLIPYDLGHTGSRTALNSATLQKILAHSISDEEILRAVEGIDAGQMLLVIDACNSGQALEAEEKRRGPMNSKGLAQLAYEKGMYILTAAQNYQAANEAERYGHGFLTYALVEEGLKTGAADREPKDGQVLLREWLNFAVERVPQMQQDELDQQKKGRQLDRSKFAEADSRNEQSFQRPRVFYRRETEPYPLVVAKP